MTWMAMDWTVNKKPTTVGACTGAVAGLVAITPAAGSVDLLGAFAIGIITPVVCFFMVAVVKALLTIQRPIEWPAEVEIELFVERLGNTSVTIGHRIVDARDSGVLYCDGNVVMVWIDRGTGRGVSAAAAAPPR